MGVNLQLAIDFDAAAEARDLGMQRAVDHANREEPEWSGQALGQLTAYANIIGRPFLIEEARVWAEAHGLPNPPDARAWGAVVKRAAHKKKPVIVRAGAAPAASSHCSLKPLWVRAATPFKELP